MFAEHLAAQGSALPHHVQTVSSHPQLRLADADANTGPMRICNIRIVTHLSGGLGRACLILAHQKMNHYAGEDLGAASLSRTDAGPGPRRGNHERSQAIGNQFSVGSQCN